ncbi:SHIRT domain-containing protein [Kallipyga gabonensis]|uniref:SHIRT domain-containing protein n=1 Tax=Kallipyga gabonensis TaxID=1686287 RepID=UPI00138E0A4A|nr:SHIRT domain-containing protein [Kallipyga gabonensis]
MDLQGLPRSVGEWTFVPNEHEVTYEYKSGTEGMDLPAELKAKAPDEVKGKVKGDTVTSPVPTGKDAEFRDEANQGTWKFQAYDRAEVTITNKNEHVVGTWVFEKDQAPATYKVTHEFRIAADSAISTFPAEVQAEVNKQLPETQSGKQDGDVVKPGALQNPQDVEDTANDGHWTFKAFLDQDPATQDVDAKINKADVNFVGEWTFVPNEHEVTYEYKSGTEGMDLPAELKAKAPDEVPGKVKGDTVTSPVPTGKDAEFRDEANQGTWKFQAYDRAEVTITNKNEHVVGTWVFEKDQAPATYKVTHKFKSADPNRELPKEVEDLLPANQTGKADGSKVMPTAPGETSVQVPDGTWTFEGYDKPEKTVEGKDVEFIGIWKFTPKTPDPEPTVHTKFVEEGTEKELAPQETGAQPKKAIEGYVYVKTVKDDAGNVTHIYKKVNVPTPQPTVHTSYIEEGTEKVLSPQEAGAQPKKAIEGYVFVKTVKDDAGNLTHIYKKVAVPAPKPSVHTNYVEEKTNKVISPQESGDKPKKAIDGYVFVKTTKDKKGNVTHIYKKVASANKKGKAPKTGDRFIAGYAAMAVLSMTTLSAMVMIGKKKETSEK